jgi:hypothetical protein
MTSASREPVENTALKVRHVHGIKNVTSHPPFRMRRGLRPRERELAEA